MQIALYDSQYGYYSSGARRTGWRGHFITSPELDPSFGELWSNAFREVWVSCGCPPDFEIVEIGPGEGGFAHAVLEAIDEDFAAAVTYRLVERVPMVRERQRERLGDRRGVVWSESITELPDISHGCVFANEVLDNLPVHLVEMREGVLQELCVSEEDGELVLEGRDPSNPELLGFLERTGTTLDEGRRMEVTLAGESLIARVAQHLHKGALVFVDYGLDTDEIARRGGTLVTYSASGADTDVLSDPGGRDITAHANWTSTTDSLRRSGMTPTNRYIQRDVLLSLGAKSLDESFKERYNVAISEGRGADAVACLSRRQALGALLDRGGLGGLHVIAGLKDIPTPSFLP